MKMEYETSRLFLKILQSDSSDKVLDFYIRNKDFLEPFEPDRVSLFYTRAFQQANLNYENKLMKDSHMLRLWLFEKSDLNKTIGSVSIQNIIKGSYLSCIISYKMDRDYLRLGYATEALYYLINIAYSLYGLHRIEAYIVPDNLPSINLIQKLGFLPEGIARSSVYLRGKWIDQIRFALISEI
ncbi:ribosomal-protein-alanine N-acetyltransferase [Mobilisporobacter senegalensis]|uniref:Ribosomal-protein-alanine N-acetyltransferase n=1 Tax=Mobilisporobacter senegalensis TaxID=1329262 RepID=A0A3N1XZE2_9FIRM|nr:GNAT family protein [Mobilisporobacter senegalensis]ROR31950.1 ribosomal-protein-alanine N-acetyltransferase [Mobilisporobacter senegalensis]